MSVYLKGAWEVAKGLFVLVQCLPMLFQIILILMKWISKNYEIQFRPAVTKELKNSFKEVAAEDSAERLNNLLDPEKEPFQRKNKL